MAESAREFFEEIETRVDPANLRSMKGSYRFDIAGAGSWRLEIADGALSVSESSAEADCVIEASEATMMKILRREQNPATAYMTGKIKVRGDVGLALGLRDVFA